MLPVVLQSIDEYMHKRNQKPIAGSIQKSSGNVTISKKIRGSIISEMSRNDNNTPVRSSYDINRKLLSGRSIKSHAMQRAFGQSKLPNIEETKANLDIDTTLEEQFTDLKDLIGKTP